MKVIFNGLATGFILQLALGPVFFITANLALQNSFLSAFFAVLGITLADYFYIILAILGVGKALEKQKFKKIFGIISSCVLMGFGAALIYSFFFSSAAPSFQGESSSNWMKSFGAGFFLTLSSPLTIVFWTGVFAAKSLEYSLNKKQLLVFGVSAGLTTVIFLGGASLFLSLVKTQVPFFLFQMMNLFVGFLIVFYGVFRIYKSINNQ